LGSLERELKAFREKWPDGKPITVDVIVNNVAVANALIDTGSAAYCFVSLNFVRRMISNAYVYWRAERPSEV
jgi:hypothetical protein